MTSNVGCWKRPHAALMIGMLWLTGCGMVSSDASAPCPPVVEYTVADQVQAADDVLALPEGCPHRPDLRRLCRPARPGAGVPVNIGPGEAQSEAR